MANISELEEFMADPESLNRLNLYELRALWRLCSPKVPPSGIRLVLLRDLARVAQSGGMKLPRETDVLVKAAMRGASVIRSPDETQDFAKIKLPSQKAALDLPVGSVLMREWGGQTHQVKVLAGGLFEYQGKSYKSLTKVAKMVTGAHWSGPCFFGLHKFRNKS